MLRLALRTNLSPLHRYLRKTHRGGLSKDHRDHKGEGGVSRLNQDSPAIITFIGPVGVGKSTQIGLTRTYLLSRNQKTVQTYLRSSHGITHILNRTVQLLRKFIRLGTRHEKALAELFAPIWVWADALSITIKFFLAVYLPHIRGYNVIIEEGLYMTLEHYQSFRPEILGLKPKNIPLIPRLLGWVNSKRHVEVLLDADDREIDTRRRSRDFRQQESKQFVSLQRKAMDKLAGPTVLRVDTTSHSIESAHQTIINGINNMEI